MTEHLDTIAFLLPIATAILSTLAATVQTIRYGRQRHALDAAITRANEAERMCDRAEKKITETTEKVDWMTAYIQDGTIPPWAVTWEQLDAMPIIALGVNRDGVLGDVRFIPHDARPTAAPVVTIAPATVSPPTPPQKPITTRPHIVDGTGYPVRDAPTEPIWYKRLDRAKEASMAHAPASEWLALGSDEDWRVRLAIAEHPAFPRQPRAVIDQAARDTDWRVRMASARGGQRMGDHAWEGLRHDSHPSVRDATRAAGRYFR